MEHILSLAYRLQYKRFWWGLLVGILWNVSMPFFLIRTTSMRILYVGLLILWFITAIISILVIIGPEAFSRLSSTKTHRRDTSDEEDSLHPPINFLYGFSIALLVLIFLSLFLVPFVKEN
jgi:hypothetical protein